MLLYEATNFPDTQALTTTFLFNDRKESASRNGNCIFWHESTEAQGTDAYCTKNPHRNFDPSYNNKMVSSRQGSISNLGRIGQTHAHRDGLSRLCSSSNEDEASLRPESKHPLTLHRPDIKTLHCPSYYHRFGTTYTTTEGSRPLLDVTVHCPRSTSGSEPQSYGEGALCNLCLTLTDGTLHAPMCQ